MVPMLDVVMQEAADQGARKVIIGMSHRGRLNVLTHVVGVSYEAILAEFELGRAGTEAGAPKGGLDDVKYHLGAEGGYLTAEDEEVRVVLSPNPSHLEAVNPVIEGRTRADQTDRSQPIATQNQQSTLPVLIHGDAAFAAQGVVAETFNLARLEGYSDRRHDPPHRQQPGRLHHRPARGTIDRLLIGPRQGLRRADRPRQRRRSGGMPGRGTPGDDVPRPVRARRGDGPRRLSALRPQRGRRAGVHPAHHVRGGREAAHGPGAVPGSSRRGRGHHRGGGRGQGRGGPRGPRAPPGRPSPGRQTNARKSSTAARRRSRPRRSRSRRRRSHSIACASSMPGSRPSPAASRCTPSWPSSWSVARRRSTLPSPTSTGGTRSSSPSPRSSRRARRSGSRARTPSAGRSASGTPACSTRRRASDMCRSSTSLPRRPASSCTTRR